LCCPLALDRYYGPLRHPPGCQRLPGAHRLYADPLPATARWGRGGLPQFLRPPSDRSTPHTPAGSLALHSRVLAPSVAFAVTHPARLPLVPLIGAAVTRRQDSRHAADRSVAPTMWLSTLRFDAERFPPTPAACYRAPWRLPGPDFHRLADASLRTRSVTPRASPPPGRTRRALWARCAAGIWR
jgi:hypothetical protein